MKAGKGRRRPFVTPKHTKSKATLACPFPNNHGNDKAPAIVLKDDSADYMSASILSDAKKIESSTKRHRVPKQSGSLGRQERKRIRLEEVDRREEVGQTPIGEDNVGFQLLAKMGFKEGSKLGKNENYQTPPYLRDLGQRGRSGLGLGAEENSALIKTALKREKRGIGAVEEARSKVERLVETSEAFDRFQLEKFQRRKVSGQWWACIKALANLKDTAGVEPPEEVLPAWVIRYLDGFEPEEGEPTWREREDAMTLDEKNHRLNLINTYLRDQFFYCVYCGTSYNDNDEMEATCPGVTEEDHE